MGEKKEDKKVRQKGITLIALVITIIILIILASITLGAIIGPNGIIQRAKEAGEKYQNAAQDEQKELEELMNMMNGSGDNSDEEEIALENIYVSLNGNTLSFYSNEETARTNADSEEHYYGNINGKRFSGEGIPWYQEREKIEKVVIVDKIMPTSTQNYFYNLSALQTIENLEKMDTSKVTSMSGMFENCSNLTSLDVQCEM